MFVATCILFTLFLSLSSLCLCSFPLFSIPSIQQQIAAVKPDIIVSSHVQYRTGFRQDINALGRVAHEHGAVYVVNTTQSMGVMPVDVQACQADFLVCSCFKWTLAGYGCGIIYINKVSISVCDVSRDGIFLSHCAKSSALCMPCRLPIRCTC